MIATETYDIKGKPFVRTYSDKGMMIEREGVQYAEANDPAELGRKYIETDIPIDVDEPEPEPVPDEPMDEIEEKATAYDILMGVSE
jgi:hypothetical protein